MDTRRAIAQKIQDEIRAERDRLYSSAHVEKPKFPRRRPVPTEHATPTQPLPAEVRTPVLTPKPGRTYFLPMKPSRQPTQPTRPNAIRPTTARPQSAFPVKSPERIRELHGFLSPPDTHGQTGTGAWQHPYHSEIPEPLRRPLLSASGSMNQELGSLW
jgi:hypothetical protein